MYSVSYDYDVVFNVATQTFDVLDSEGNEVLAWDQVYANFLSDLMQYEEEHGSSKIMFPFKASVMFEKHYSDQLDHILCDDLGMQTKAKHREWQFKQLLLTEACIYASAVVVEDQQDQSIAFEYSSTRAIAAPHSTAGMLRATDKLLALLQSIQIKIPGAAALAAFAHSLVESTFKRRLVRSLYLSILLEMAEYGGWLPLDLVAPLSGLRTLLKLRNKSRMQLMGIEVCDGETGC